MKEIIPMFIPVEQRPEPPTPYPAPIAEAAPSAEAAARQPEPLAELPKVTEELLIEEVSIDGMCGVY